MLLNEFYIKKGIRKLQEMTNLKPSPILDFMLPDFSMIHYMPTVEEEVGIDIQHPMLLAVEEDILVEHDFDLLLEQGTAREVHVNKDKIIKTYHRRYLKARRLLKLETALRSKRNPIVVNHAVATQVYKYRRTPMSTSNEAYNMLFSTWSGIVRKLDTNWNHWIPLEVPERIPSIEIMKKAETEIDRNMITYYDEVTELQMLELWKYLRGLPCMMDMVPIEQHKQINFLWIESGKWAWLRLSDLTEWKEKNKGDVVAKAYMKFMETMVSTRTVVDFQSEDEDAESELVGISETALTKPIMDKADELVSIGRMSVPEHRRMQRLALKYQSIANPIGEGTLSEYLNIDKKSLNVNARRFPNITGVMDDGMLQSTITSFDTKYIDEVFGKDIANMAVACQHAGIAVTDFKVAEKIDIAGASVTYSVKLQPVDGAPSTIEFTVPKVKKDGTYKINGVSYRMAKQPSDLPIRKVKPGRVALTSYYGKVFVTRSERTVDDYSAWVVKRIIASSVGKDSIYLNMHYGNFTNPRIRVPRIYSGVASRTSGFTYNDITFNFDYSARERLYGADTLKKYEVDGSVVCGTVGKDHILVHMDDTFTRVGKVTQELGPLEKLVDITGKVPIDTAIINIFGKPFPVGMVLGYYMGLSKLLKTLDARYRIVPKGTRVTLADDEFSIVFKDETLVLSRADKITAIILSGFNSYAKQIKDVPMHSFDKPTIYNTVLARPNVRPTRYLKEIELMFTMFIDHITLELLNEMKEPTVLSKLLIRSCELLTTDDHPDEADTRFVRYRGYERMAGMFYSELISSIRGYRARPANTGAKVSMNPYAVSMAIQKDASVTLVEESNPIHNLKEKELVTHSGAGGRSARAMNKTSRMYHKSNIGTISEAGVDSAKVGINFSLSANPKFNSVRGTTDPFDKEHDSMVRVMSTTASLSPFIDRDSSKRINFASIQHDSAVGCKNYRPQPLTTGYEKVIAHRTDDLYAHAATFDGKITDLSDSHVELTSNDGEQVVTIELGIRHGTVSGTSVPHEIICDMPLGAKFIAGTVITYNTYFFVRDFFDPTQVQWTAGLMATTVLVEAAETLEDSSSLSDELSKELTTSTTTIRPISLNFDQSIMNLVKVGDKVDADSILCTIEDGVLDVDSKIDINTLQALDELSAITPRAGNAGIVERIDVIYYGDKENMTESLKRETNISDKKLAERAKKLGGDEPKNGQVSTVMRVNGLPIHPDMAVVKIYIGKEHTSGAGDKAVFGNASKSVFGSVMTGRNETASGIKIDAKFAQHGIDARKVNSPALMGTSNKLLEVFTDRMVDLYFE